MALAILACDPAAPEADGGRDAGGATDAGTVQDGGARDAGADGGAAMDAGTADAGAADAGAADAGSDAGGAPDAGQVVRFAALDTGGRLVQFTLDDPDAVTSRSITGLMTAETLIALDVRPATGQLLALSSQGRLYVLDVTTGAAVILTPPIDPPLGGTAVGLDVNPSVDRIRVVSNSGGENFRVNPLDGARVSDSPARYVAADLYDGQTPLLVGAAYTPAEPLATTTLYAIDTQHDVLVRVAAPNAGATQTVGALGVAVADGVGFDIGADFSAYASATVGGVSRLYRVDLSTGAATAVAPIGGSAVHALAILP